MTTHLITNSRMQCFHACPRLHRFRYVDGIRPIVDAEALTFGTVMHAGLECWWNAVPHEFAAGVALGKALMGIAAAAGGLDDASRATAELLMAAYDLRWAPTMDEYEVIGVERQFEAPMIGPSGRRARGLRIAGKIDALVRKRADGSVWIVEHKTSGADLSSGSTYWQRLRTDGQVSFYFDGARALGHEIAGCLYDVIAKPGLRPLKATPEDKRKYTQQGRLYAGQREADETPDEFKLRLADVISADPLAHFQRQEVIRLDTELEDARRDAYETALMIRDAANKDRHPRSLGACHQYGRICEMYAVCSGAASADDPTLYRRSEIHPELAGSQ